MIRIINAASRTRPTENTVMYGSGTDKFYVRKTSLKDAGCNEAPQRLYQIITDELPEGWEMPQEETVEFTL